MKQKFNKQLHEKFKTYFWLKNNPNKIEQEYIEKIIKYIKYIKWIPWLRMIWVWNSLSMFCATKQSDIDLFIVTTPNSMWLNRIIITMIFQILWVRKNKKNHSWRFCLSFFATTDWLDFNSWKITNDIYLYFWMIYLKPILNYNNTYELFIQKNNSWADFSEYNDIILNNKKYIKYFWNKKNNNTKIINHILKIIFLPKTIKHYNKLWKPFGIIINNNMLKFHNNDIRKKIKEIIK
jgi:hypothetical protein